MMMNSRTPFIAAWVTHPDGRRQSRVAKSYTRKTAVPAIARVVGAVGAIATGHLGLAVPTGGFAVNGMNELIQAQMKRTEFRKKTPMSVFIDLNEKKT